jgi:hypothetical protein
VALKVFEDFLGLKKKGEKGSTDKSVELLPFKCPSIISLRVHAKMDACRCCTHTLCPPTDCLTSHQEETGPAVERLGAHTKSVDTHLVIIAWRQEIS